MKSWQAVVQLNYDASHWKITTTKANTERKARISIEDKLRKQGYFATQIISVVEVQNANDTT